MDRGCERGREGNRLRQRERGADRQREDWEREMWRYKGREKGVERQKEKGR